MPATSAPERAAASASAASAAAAKPAPAAPALGQHVLADLNGCTPGRIATLASVEPAFLRAVAESGATILSHRSHQFEPHGVTIVVLLAESHASVHTWPERGYAAVDFFTCGTSMDAQATVRRLVLAFGAESADVRVIARGVQA